MSDSDDTSIMSKLAGTFGFLVGASLILSFFVATFAINYIDEKIEEDCESITGQIGQVVGADEGQCDEGSAIRDLLAVIRFPLLLAGVVVCLIAAKVF
jgi:hypothetical protein